MAYLDDRYGLTPQFDDRLNGHAPRWTYAPLIAWVVCSLWPIVFLMCDLLRGMSLPYGGIATLMKGVFEFMLALAVANWAFVPLFFAVRRRAKEAARQLRPIGSFLGAMWFSLAVMLVPTALLMLLLYYMSHYGPQGRGSGVGNGIVLLLFLFLQLFLQPMLGLIAWFAGRQWAS
jgi:hypothetical protein